MNQSMQRTTIPGESKTMRGMWPSQFDVDFLLSNPRDPASKFISLATGSTIFLLPSQASMSASTDPPVEKSAPEFQRIVRERGRTWNKRSLRAPRQIERQKVKRSRPGKGKSFPRSPVTFLPPRYNPYVGNRVPGYQRCTRTRKYRVWYIFLLGLDRIPEILEVTEDETWSQNNGQTLC